MKKVTITQINLGSIIMKISVGCAGYSYDDWKGGFYPKSLPKSEYFSYYAKYFDFTEVNSTYYQPPSQNMVNHWVEHSPEKFRFALKMFREVTPLRSGVDLDPLISRFFSPLQPIKTKISAVLLQYPPNYKFTPEHKTKIENTIKLLPPSYQYILEFRHASWFQENPKFWTENYPNIFLGTSYMDKIDPFYIPHQKIYYIRVIGDRSLSTFSRQQRQMQEMWDHLIMKTKGLIEKSEITDLFVIFNNHFRGFSPEDVAELKKKLGINQKSFKTQKSLSDFF
jgi:uncharacterized protein YecE (DUF72 family)